MQYLENIEDFEGNVGTAMTLGKFDGMHIGHRLLVEKINEKAKEKGLETVVFVFDMHRQLKLMDSEERKLVLNGMTDYLIFCPFTKEIREMSAKDFIKKILVNLFHVRYLVVGEDFRFGYNRMGDTKLLEEYAAHYGYEVEVIKKETYEGRVVSSSYIKELLKEANMALVERLMTLPYTLVGEVKRGKQIGRTICVPTMNITPIRNKMLPPFGVYASEVFMDGKVYRGISNIGEKPTVSTEGIVFIETHLFDYNEEAYGKQIAVRIYERCRGEMKFSTLQELQAQIEKDIQWGKEFFLNKKEKM